MSGEVVAVVGSHGIFVCDDDEEEGGGGEFVDEFCDAEAGLALDFM